VKQRVHGPAGDIQQRVDLHLRRLVSVPSAACSRRA